MIMAVDTLTPHPNGQWPSTEVLLIALSTLWLLAFVHYVPMCAAFLRHQLSVLLAGALDGSERLFTILILEVGIAFLLILKLISCHDRHAPLSHPEM